LFLNQLSQKSHSTFRTGALVASIRVFGSLPASMKPAASAFAKVAAVLERSATEAAAQWLFRLNVAYRVRLCR